MEIIDVEKVLAEIVPTTPRSPVKNLKTRCLERARGREVLLVDDSNVALSQLRDTLGQLGVKMHIASDGLKALNMLKAWADAGRRDDSTSSLMIFTDAEMPEMDGYRLTTEIRNDPRLRKLYVVLHTSLSGSFNDSMVKKVGCDNFLSQFQPDKLVDVVRQRLMLELKRPSRAGTRAAAVAAALGVSLRLYHPELAHASQRVGSLPTQVGRGASPGRVAVRPAGLAGDRRWMLVEQDKG